MTEQERMARVADEDIAEFMLMCADHMSVGGVWTLHQVVMLMREGAVRIKQAEVERASHRAPEGSCYCCTCGGRGWFMPD